MARYTTPAPYSSGRLRWDEIILETGEKAFIAKDRWKTVPICIAKRVLDYGRLTEWVVYVNGCLVGASPEWAEAETLARTTYELMQESGL